LLFSVCHAHHSVIVGHYMYSAAEGVRYNQKPQTTLSSWTPCRFLLPLTYMPVGNHIITLHHITTIPCFITSSSLAVSMIRDFGPFRLEGKPFFSF
jgi:hypothetical protein